MSVLVFVKKLDPEAKLPEKSTHGSAGYDLFALEDVDVNEHAVVRTGIALDIPPYHVGMVFARSGTAFKKKLTLSNSTGILDSDYRGEVKVAISDLKKEPELYQIKKGDKIAQLIVMPAPLVMFEETEKLTKTERGQGGFGSTGR